MVAAPTLYAQVTMSQREYDSLLNLSKEIHRQTGELVTTIKSFPDSIPIPPDSIPDPGPEPEPIPPDAYETIINDTDPATKFAGGPWYPVSKPTMGGKYTDVKDSYVEIRIDGIGFAIVSERYPSHGISEIYIDGVKVAYVDHYSPAPEEVATVYTSNKLTEEVHIVRMVVTGDKRPVSQGANVVYDKIKVYHSEAPEPPPVGQFDFYVSPGGNDNNDGSVNKPFKTGTKAGQVARDGDEIAFRTGTYRETIVPAANGVTFIAYPGETVYISGLNEVDNAGWTIHSGNIYKKTITLPVNGYTLNITSNTTIAANQVFKDGNMVIAARWPKANNVEAQFDRATLRRRNQTQGWNGGSITDNGIPQIAGGWTGGKIFVCGWFAAQTGSITGQSGSTINIGGLPSTGTDFCQYYYLTGKLGALTQANEFHYENGTLYVWQPGGGAPTNIEYKARNWGFNLAGRSRIKIKDIKFIGCEINGDGATADVIIDNARFKYLNHTFLNEFPPAEGRDALAQTLYGNPRQTGLKLLGRNNIVRNSEFKYAASNGITLGAYGTVDNNKFEYINYEGNYGAPVLLQVGSTNVKVLRNTLANLGRSSIDFGWLEKDTHTNNEYGYNDTYNFGMLSSDGGSVYAARYQNLGGTRVHHNWIHNSKAEHTPSGGAQGINAGIYYDQGTGSGTVNDHNILWDNRQNDLHITTESNVVSRGPCTFINNITMTKVYPDNQWVHGYWSYLNIANAYIDKMRNNVFHARVIAKDWAEITQNGQAGFDAQGNIFRVTTVQIFAGGNEFNPVNIPDPGAYFQLTSNSPARNIGVNMPGYNDSDIDGKDAGAYYYGQPAWKAGYTAGLVTPPVKAIDYRLVILGVIILILIIIAILYFTRKRPK